MTSKTNTDDEAAFWVHKYLLLRGEVKMRDLGMMTPAMTKVVNAYRMG